MNGDGLTHTCLGLQAHFTLAQPPYSLQRIPNYFPVWKHFLASCCQQKSLISVEPMKSAKTEMRDNIVFFSQLIGNGPFPINLFSVFKRSYFCADIGFIIVRGFKKKTRRKSIKNEERFVLIESGLSHCLFHFSVLYKFFQPDVNFLPSHLLLFTPLL